MAFSVSYKKAERPRFPEGKYEMVIDKTGYANGKNGEYISLALMANEKVHPELEGRQVYMNLFKAKSPTADDSACEGYQAWQISMISRAVGIPDGQELNSVNEWLNVINHTLVKATIRHNGDYVNVTQLEPSEADMDIFDTETLTEVEINEKDLQF